MKDTTIFQSKIITYFTYAKVKSENSDFKKRISASTKLRSKDQVVGGSLLEISDEVVRGPLLI